MGEGSRKSKKPAKVQQPRPHRQAARAAQVQRHRQVRHRPQLRQRKQQRQQVIRDLDAINICTATKSFQVQRPRLRQAAQALQALQPQPHPPKQRPQQAQLAPQLDAYFDPAGFLALSDPEKCFIEQNIKSLLANETCKLTHSVTATLDSSATTANTSVKLNLHEKSNRSAMDVFNESVGEFTHEEQP
ncbi:unnamed protein product, partial [Rotaria sp. Silwood2]